MTLNIFTVVASLLIGAVTGIASSHTLRSGCTARAALLRALLVGAAGTALAIVGSVVLAGIDGFAMIHAVYLVIVISIPLAAVIVLYRAAPLPIPLAVLMCALLFLAPLGMYTTRVEPFWLRVDRADLAMTGVDTAFRVGVLSDLQTVGIGGYENDAIDRLLAEEPDVVLIPGDFYQLPPEDFDDRAPQFRAVMERLGSAAPLVVVVNGNTDTIAGLELLTRDTGVVLLDNQAIDTTLAGNEIRIGGISLSTDDAGAARTIRQLNTATEIGRPTILLAHQPDEIFRLDGNTVDLMVAGHTHGGQISLPFLGPPLTLSSVPRSIGAGGLGELLGSPIYVSTGVGRERHNAPQIRFGARPSIGIIDITPG